MARRRANSKSIKVDFSGVETLSKMEEGEQLLKVIEVTKEQGDKAPYLSWTLENEDGARCYNNTSLSEKSLWNLKAWLEALGVEVPDEEMDIDLEEMVDRELMASIELETYEGKKRPRIVDFWSAEDGGSSKGKDEEVDIDEMDEDDLAKLIKKKKLDIDPDDYPKIKKLRKAVQEALEEADEEEEEEPKEKKGKKGKKKDTPSAEDIDEMDQDDLEKVVEDLSLEIDLSKYKTLRKMQAAVKDALE